MADHLLSLVALVAMERPVSRSDEDIRDAKAHVLNSIRPARLDRSLLARCVVSFNSRSVLCVLTAEPLSTKI